MGHPFPLCTHLPPQASPLSGFHFFVYFSSLNIRHAVPGTPDGSLTFNLVFPLYWTFSLCVILSVCLSLWFVFPLHLQPFLFVFV